MKSFAIAATAILAVASAKPVEKRIVAQDFDVDSFYAGCIPHGTGCSVSFNVATNQMPSTTACSANFPTVAFELPNVPFTACADPSIIFSLQAIGLSEADASNYTLILADAEQSLAAAKIWPASNFPIVNAGSTVYQQYNGETRFVVQ